MSGRIETLTFKAICQLALFVMLIVCPVNVFALGGNLEWLYNSAVVGKQEPLAMAVDSAGNVILTGFEESSSDDYLTSKILADGSGLSWPVKTFDYAGAQDRATSVAVDSNDDIIVTGYVHNGSNYDIHTIKYSGVDGAVLWQHTYDGPGNGNDFANAITVDALNNIFVGGIVQDASAKDDFVIIKYVPDGPNPDGSPTWVTTYKGPDGLHDRLTSIAVGVGGIAVTGESQNVAADFDFVVAKLTLDGTQLWEKRYSDSGNGKGLDVAIDASGNVIATGYVHNGTDWDHYTVKYSSDGSSEVWSRTRDRGYDDEGHTLWLDSAGNVFVAGYSFTLTTNKDLSVTRYAAVDGSDAAPDGWHVDYNTANGNSDVAVDIVGDDSGDIFVTTITHVNAESFDDIHTYKFCKEHGTLLWSAIHGTLTNHDRSVGIGLTPDGHPLVAGWSGSLTSGYDFIAAKYNAGVLNAPTTLIATTVSSSQIDLSWVDNSDNEENFVVERKNGTSEWSVVASDLPANTTSFNDTGLITDHRYYYRVKAINSLDGSSPYSNEANARTTVISYDPPEWQYIYAGADGGDDEPAAIAVGPDNHPVVTGFSFSFEGGYDYYTIKLDYADETITHWSSRYNDDDNESDFAKAVAVDSSNRAVVSGYASLYGGGISNTNDIYTLGYPSDSPLPTWSHQYNGPSGSDDRSAAVATAVDGSDNAVVVGYGKNDLFNDDIYVIKYSADGLPQVPLWAATPYDGGGDDQPADVAYDLNDDIYVVGKTWNGSDFDYFVAKYNGSDGSLAWGGVPRFYNGSGNSTDYATSLAVDTLGNLYVTGYSVGNSGSGDIVTIKYDGVTGVIMSGWPKIYDGGGYDSGVSVSIDTINNDVVVAGTTYKGPGNHDVMVVRYTADGNEVWSQFLDFDGSDESAAAMSIDRSGVTCVAAASNDGSGDDIVSVMFDHQGEIVGAKVFNGTDDGTDYPVDVAYNAYGEAFVAGVSTNSGNNTDFIVYKVTSTVEQAPSPLNATLLYTEAALSWADNSLDEDGYRIERKTGACSDAGTWTLVDETVANETSYLVSGLNPGDAYCLRVQSFNVLGETSRWVEVDVVTVEEDAPDALTAEALSSTEIKLVWNDNTIGETGFNLQRCAGAVCDFSTYTNIPVAQDTTSYVDSDVCEGQTYRYRINAYKTGQWVSDFSLPTADLTAEIKQAPTNLDTDWVSEEWVELKWTDNSSDESEYRVERCEGSGCTNFFPLGTILSPSGNVLHMRMDESSWPTTPGAVIDSSGADNNGTAVSGAVPVANGRYANAGSFDGNDDYVSTALVIDQSLETSPGATFSVWAYPFSISANNHFLIGTDDGGNDWSLLRNAGFWYVANGADAALVNTGVAVDVDSWQHLVVSFDPSSGVTLYKDGVPVWSDAAIEFDEISATVHIGRRGSLNQEFFDGLMDEVAIFNKPVSNEEALNLYEHGVARYNDRTVSHSTTYRYQVVGSKDASCSWVSAPASAIEVTTFPPAPSNFSATVVDSGRVFLEWTDNTTSETGYRIERCNGSGCVDLTEVITTASDTSHYMDEGLCADPDTAIVYTYRLTSIKDPEWSSSASTVEATIPQLSMPTGFISNNETEDRIPLEWTYGFTDLSNLVLARCDGDDIHCSSPGNYTIYNTISPEPTGNLMMLHMDEDNWSGVVGEVVDTSGSGNHGTAYNGTASISDGNFIRGGQFDGVNDYITTSLNIDQGGTAAVTFEAWVYPTVNSNSYKFVISTDNGGADWGLALYANRWYVHNGAGIYNTSQTATFNAWQHMVVTFDPAVGTVLYRNGVPIWSGAIGYDTVDGNVTIGRQGNYAQNYFPGKIDEVAVYGRALSVDEVADRYNRKYRFTHTGLMHSSPYWYKLWAEKTTGCPWVSNPVVLNSATLEPSVPGNLIVTAPQTTQIDLSWDDDATSETGYRIEHCAGIGADCDEDAEFALLADLANDSTSFSDMTVCYNTAHTYRVRTEKNDGPLWQSAWVEGSEVTPDVEPPANFSAVGVSESEIALSWDDTTIDEDDFILERCEGTGAACDEDVEFSSLVTNIPGTISGNQLHYRMDELAWTADAGQVLDSSGSGRDGQAYYGLTTGLDGKFGRAGYFDGSNDFIVTPLNVDQTWGGAGATFEAWVYPTIQDTTYRYVFSTENGGNDWGLLAYNGLWYVVTGEALRSTGISVTLNQWQHVAVAYSPEGAAIRFYKNGVETIMNVAYIGYDSSSNNVNIGRRANGSYYFMGRIDEFAVYDHPLSQAEIQQHYQRQIQVFEHVDNGLAPGTTYTYRVKAARTADCGWASTALAVGSTQDPPPPSSFAASSINTTQIDLAWDDNSGSETAYHLQRCQGSGCVDFADFITLLGPDTNSYSDTTVCPGLIYRYRVRAEKSDVPTWNTTWVGPVEATTNSQDDPVTLSATRIAENRIDLTWVDSNPDESGFSVERCSGSGCSDFVEVATVPASDIGENKILGANGAVGSFLTNVTDVTHPRSGQVVKALQLTHSGSVPTSQSATLNLQPDIQYLVTFEAWTDAGSNIDLQNDLFPDTLPDVIQTIGPQLKSYQAVFASSDANMASCVLRFFHDNAGRTIYVTNINLRQLTYPVTYSDLDTGLAPGSTYNYRVKAFKDADCGWGSGYSNNDEATTSVLAPSDLAATAVDTTTIELNWADNASTETDTLIERCDGVGCSDFVQIDSVVQGIETYTDNSVANGSSYSYRVKSVGLGLSASGGSSWTRRKPVNFTSFDAGQIYEVDVLYDVAMRSDFADLRFYDETAKMQLPYWVKSKVDGVSATVWFKTRANDTINLYYANPDAGDAGNQEDMKETYTFDGTVIDSDAWVEIDPVGGISQNNALLLNDVTDSWSMALISKATYERSAGLELLIDLSIPADTAGNNHFMAGWDVNQTSSANYNQLVHGFYWNNYSFLTYEKGGNTGGTGNYTASTDYQMKVLLKDIGAQYYVRGGAYADWSLVRETSTYSDTNLRIAIHEYSHAAQIHKIVVTPGSINTGVTLGAEEVDSGYIFDFTWTGGYSNEATTLTPVKEAPENLIATAVTNSQIDLVWLDKSSDESGFKLERCQGSGCSDFLEIAVLAENENTYIDTGLLASTIYRYRVKAFKTATQSWDSGYVEAEDLTFSPLATGLTAVPLTARMIQLNWSDNATDEDGYEIEVKVWNGHFISTGRVGPDQTSYIDKIGVDPGETYVYRVRPYRGNDQPPYSNEATATTNLNDGLGTCSAP